MVEREEEALDVLRSVRVGEEEARGELKEILDVCRFMRGSVSGEGGRGGLDHPHYGTDGGNDDDDGNNGIDDTFLDSRILEEEEKPSFLSQIKNMINHAPTRRALILGCGIMVLQQLSGINTVMYYAASIYKMSGFDGSLCVCMG